MSQYEHELAEERREQYHQCFRDLRDIHHTHPSVLETILYMNVVNDKGSADIAAVVQALVEMKKERR